MNLDKKILINFDPREVRVAILEQEKLEWFFVERPQQQRIVGNVYLGKVKNIAASIDASFVDIGLAKEGFLYVDEILGPALPDYVDVEEELKEAFPHDREKRHKSIEEVIARNQDVLVQVVKEPIGTKGARLTTHIAMPGKFVVMMPYDKHIGISKKITDAKERRRIKDILTSLDFIKEYGVIARTQSVGCTKANLISELRYMVKTWQWIEKRYRRSKAPALIYQEQNLPIRILRDIFDETVNVAVIDSLKEFKNAMYFLRHTTPKLCNRLKMYKESRPLFEKYGIEEEIEKIYERRVSLKNGGYLIFDEAESLVAVDVNTGAGKGDKGLEDTIYRTNLQAAEELARQLRLRDVGGIIVIDFIDMKQREQRHNVLETLKKALNKDYAKTHVLSISEFGLVEMTRQRIRKSLEGFSYQKCPYCGGRGLVKSLETMSIYAVKKLELGLKGMRAKEAQLNVNPALADYILKSFSDQLKRIEQKCRTKVTVVPNANFHIEDVNLVII